MTNRLFYIIIILFFYTSNCFSQANDSIVNYLSFPTTIYFGDKTYTLNSSSHSSENHYKQEYILLGDTSSRFNTKIYFEVAFLEKIDLPSIVNKKIATIKKEKERNRIVDHGVYSKEGAYLLHFMISQLSDVTKEVISTGRHVNLFKKFKDKGTNREGVILFGFSANSRGENIDDPEIPINAMRKYVLKDVGSFIIPEISIKK